VFLVFFFFFFFQREKIFFFCKHDLVTVDRYCAANSIVALLLTRNQEHNSRKPSRSHLASQKTFAKSSWQRKARYHADGSRTHSAAHKDAHSAEDSSAILPTPIAPGLSNGCAPWVCPAMTGPRRRMDVRIVVLMARALCLSVGVAPRRMCGRRFSACRRNSWFSQSSADRCCHWCQMCSHTIFLFVVSLACRQR
jgi:hypothetical protein